MAGKTVIAIAHRLSTIAAMDRLVIMDKGRIVEDGSHASLLKRGGVYADLWARQSGGFLAEAVAAASSRADEAGGGGILLLPHAPCLHGHAMPRTTSRVQPYDTSTQQSLERLEALAKLMDSAFLVPGTNIRMGLDAIIGLVPVVGDLVSGAISSYLIWEARRLGASRWVIGRMAANTLIDTTFGVIPILGDAFDVLFRSNMKNLALLRRHLTKKGLAGPTSGPVIDGEAVRLS